MTTATSKSVIKQAAPKPTPMSTHFVIVYLTCFSLALILYFVTCLRDPGFVTRGVVDNASPTGKFWNHYAGVGEKDEEGMGT